MRPASLVTDNASVSVTGVGELERHRVVLPLRPLPTRSRRHRASVHERRRPGRHEGRRQQSHHAAGTTATSDPLKLTAVGRYCWRGFFDSPTQGVPDATDASAGECFEVIPVTPTITTNATAAAEINERDQRHGHVDRHGEQAGDERQPSRDVPVDPRSRDREQRRGRERLDHVQGLQGQRDVRRRIAASPSAHVHGQRRLSARLRPGQLHSGARRARTAGSPRTPATRRTRRA